jgi:hypothetical protein
MEMEGPKKTDQPKAPEEKKEVEIPRRKGKAPRRRSMAEEVEFEYEKIINAN